MVNGCPLAILEGFIPFTKFSPLTLGSSSWPTPPSPPRDTSERRVLAGKAATIGREVGVNSALEPEPGGGEASFLGKILSGRKLNWGYESWGWGPLERNRIRTLVQTQGLRFVHWFVLLSFPKRLHIYISCAATTHNMHTFQVCWWCHPVIHAWDDRMPRRQKSRFRRLQFVPSRWLGDICIKLPHVEIFSWVWRLLPKTRPWVQPAVQFVLNLRETFPKSTHSCPQKNAKNVQ